MNYTYQQVKPIIARCMTAINSDAQLHNQKIKDIKMLATKCYSITIEEKYRMEIYPQGVFLYRNNDLISYIKGLKITGITTHLNQALKFA